MDCRVSRITGSRDSRHRPTALTCPAELVSCAERNLFVPPISALSIWFGSRDTFSDFGMRLEVLSAIYESTSRRSTADFADKVVPHFLENISKVPNGELVRVLITLNSYPFQEWWSRRAEIQDAVLGQLDDPEDIGDWSLLRDALDLIETMSEYEEELKGRFEGFLDDWIADASNIAEEASDDDEVDLPLDELNELEALADRWEVYAIGLSGLIEGFEEIADERDAIVSQRARQERNINQPTLFEASDIGTKPDGSIFDRL